MQGLRNVTATGRTKRKNDQSRKRRRPFEVGLSFKPRFKFNDFARCERHREHWTTRGGLQEHTESPFKDCVLTNNLRNRRKLFLDLKILYMIRIKYRQSWFSASNCESESDMIYISYIVIYDMAGQVRLVVFIVYKMTITVPSKVG